MSRENEASENTESPPEPRPRMLLPVVLAVFLGASITVLVGGGIMAFKKINAMGTELSALKQADKKKTAAIEELLGQIEDLSGQMRTLKDYSIARSTSSPKKSEIPAAPETTESLPPAKPEPRVTTTKPDELAKPSQPAQTPADKKPEAPGPAPVPAKPKEPPRESCDLMGKTSEEQAATLKRCVGAMDTVPPAPEKTGNTKNSRK